MSKKTRTVCRGGGARQQRPIARAELARLAIRTTRVVVAGGVGEPGPRGVVIASTKLQAPVQKAMSQVSVPKRKPNTRQLKHAAREIKCAGPGGLGGPQQQLQLLTCNSWRHLETAVQYRNFPVFPRPCRRVPLSANQTQAKAKVLQRTEIRDFVQERARQHCNTRWVGGFIQ